MSNSKIQKPQTIIVSWDGPYSIEEVKALDCSNEINGNGFYLIVGTLKRRSIKSLDYCGITTRSFGERLYEHEQTGKFTRFKGETEIWLGNCKQPANPHEATLRRVENMLIKSWNVSGNKQGKVNFPATTCLVMRWYLKNGQPRKRHPDFMCDLPDVLWFEDRIIWTGKLKTKSAA